MDKDEIIYSATDSVALDQNTLYSLPSNIFDLSYYERDSDDDTITRGSYSDDYSECSIDIHQIKSPIEFNNNTLMPSKNNFVCGICKTINKSQVVVLNCSCVFHIKCISKIHYNLYENRPKNQRINDFVKSLKCFQCGAIIHPTILAYIHSTSKMNCDMLMNTNEKHILELNEQIDKLRDDLDASYSYNDKLRYEYNISSDIFKNVF